MTEKLKKLFLALIVGGAGGSLAHAFDLPLAWMIGSMGATLIAALYRLPVQVPMEFRSIFLAVLGTFLGSSFTAQTMVRAMDWPLSLAAVVVFVVVMTLAMTFYYRKMAGLDGVTALFSSAPGGLTAMTVIGGACGAKEHQIALTQGIRAVMVVFLTPGLVFGLLGYRMSEQGTASMPFVWQDSLLLIISVGIGIFLAKKIKMPAATLTGAMFASAFVHMAGWVSGGLPDILLGITLWVLGSAIGARFYAIPIQELLGLALHSVGAVIVMLMITLAFSWGVSQALDLAFLPVLLAFAPGGVAEMCLIALALDIDPAFVALHHLVRISLILLPGPFLARLIFKQ